MDDLFIQEEVVVKTEPGDESFEENLAEKFLLDVPHTDDLMAYLNNHTNSKDKNFIKKETFVPEDNGNIFESGNHFMDPDAMIAHYEEVVQDINTPVVNSEDLLMAIRESPRKETKQKKSGKKKKSKNDLSSSAPKMKALKNIVIKTEEPDEDHSRGFSFECSLCLFTTVSEQHLKQHMLEHIGGPDTDTFVEESHNGEVYTCLFCPFISTSAELFKDHIKFKHTGSPTRASRKRTRESRRAPPPPPESDDDDDDGEDTEAQITPVPGYMASSDVLPCKICSTVTVSREELHKHMVQCHRQKLLECSHCDFFTVYKSTLKRHEMRHSQVKLFKCKFCNFSTYNISTFENHELSHTELKPFPCDECHFRAKSKDSLRQHKKLHSGDMPFICSYCSYKAGKKSRIIRHERIHTGERPYACPHCSFRCNQGSTLKIHIRRHTGEKPYECHLCSFRAVSKCSLNAHLKKHNTSKGGEFICSICEQIYNNKAALLKHEKSHEEENLGGYMKAITNKKRKSDYLADSVLTSTASPAAKQTSRKRQRTSSATKRKSKKIENVADISSSPIARLYRCTVCTFRCSKFVELSDHMSSHKGPADGVSSPVIPKKYRCTPCNVSFSRKREMKNHMKQKHERKEKDVTIKIGDYVLSVSDD